MILFGIMIIFEYDFMILAGLQPDGQLQAHGIVLAHWAFFAVVEVACLFTAVLFRSRNKCSCIIVKSLVYCTHITVLFRLQKASIAWLL